MIDSGEFERTISTNMDFAAALNNICNTYRSEVVPTNPEAPYLIPSPIFPLPLVLQQLVAASQTLNPSLISSTTLPISQPISTANTQKKSSNGIDLNNGSTTTIKSNNNKFHGRHSIWRFFCVVREESIYRCLVGECTATYTWPPSTTVAGKYFLSSC